MEPFRDMSRVRAGILGGLFIAVVCVVWMGARMRFAQDPLARGKTAYSRQDWESAANLARAHLKAVPEDGEALRLLARATLRLGREQPARSIYGDLGSLEHLEPEDLYLLGRLFRDQGEQDMAVYCWDQGLKVDPKQPFLLLEMAKLELAAGRPFSALDFARRLSAVPAWEFCGNLLSGQAHLALGDSQAAVEALTPTVERGPTPRDAPLTATGYRKLLARALLRLGKGAQARTVLAAVDPSSADAETEWLTSRACLQQGDLPAAARHLTRGASYRETHPLEPEPSPYVGAARCAGCHREIYETQQSSLHSRTFRRAAELDPGLFPKEPVKDRLDPQYIHTLSRREGEIQFATRGREGVFKAVVEYAFGSGDRGLSLVARDDLGRNHECRLSRYGDLNGWDVTIGHPGVAPQDEHGLGRVLDVDLLNGCFSCHVTEIRAARDGSGPAAADHAIGCERCHGPGGHHVAAAAAGKAVYRDVSIVQPRRVSPAEMVSVCADCHGLRGGQEVSRDDPVAVRLQAATLQWSRCFSASGGRLGCITCHNPHRGVTHSTTFYESRCLGCHRKASTPPLESVSLGAVAPGGTVPCPVNPTTGCISCHMPLVTAVLPHRAFTDHYIRVHPSTGKEGSVHRASGE